MAELGQSMAEFRHGFRSRSPGRFHLDVLWKSVMARSAFAISGRRLYNSILLYRNAEGLETMPLSIKNPVTERLARQLAKETGQSITLAIQHSLKESLQRLPDRRRGRIMSGRFEDILRRVDALPTLDTRPLDEILGYDERGLPTDDH